MAEHLLRLGYGAALMACVLLAAAFLAAVLVGMVMGLGLAWDHARKQRWWDYFVNTLWAVVAMAGVYALGAAARGSL